jgi:hypothetical protein
MLRALESEVVRLAYFILGCGAGYKCQARQEYQEPRASEYFCQSFLCCHRSLPLAQFAPSSHMQNIAQLTGEIEYHFHH